ncbi:MAG: GNAT family N-acetyltransferase [Blastocatellales bacterium]|nr:GNAT family N-acetyltransferase [Blastocatellales bacterium]
MMIRSGNYTIRTARHDDLPRLPLVEQAASMLFAGTKYAGEIVADSLPLEFLEAQHKAGLVWVAVDSDGEAAGFAVVMIVDDCAHLHELSVDPAHGRRGIGSRLVAAVVEWAKQCGYESLTLSTFRDIEWNAPYYWRLGFRELEDGDLSAGLQRIRSLEAESGLPIEDRICMILML